MEFPKKGPEDEPEANTLRFRKVTWNRLRRVASYEDESMNAAGDFLMTWALDDWDQTQARKGLARRSTDPLPPEPAKKKRR